MKKIKLMIIGAHPDDCDICAGGTTLKLLENGGEVCFLSVSNGNHGHQVHTCEELAARRFNETQAVGKKYGIDYRVLDIPDCHVEATVENRVKVTAAIRNYNPDIIFTHRPCDYHVDHRNTAQLVLDSAYLLAVPLFCPEAPAMKKMPIILHMQDNFVKPYPFEPTVAVDTSAYEAEKMEMLSMQESQFIEWLPWIDGYADEVPADHEGQLEMIYKHWGIRDFNNANKYRDFLIEKYGEEKGNAIKHAEFFEICEYGTVISKEELNEIFD